MIPDAPTLAPAGNLNHVVGRDKIGDSSPRNGRRIRGITRDEHLHNILDRLKNVRPAGDHYTACCPAHEDRVASLTVKTGDKAVLVTCHASCTFSEIAAAMSLSESDFFFDDPHANDTGRVNGHGQAKKKKTLHTTWLRAIVAGEFHLRQKYKIPAKYVNGWNYHGADGTEYGRVARFKFDNGDKTFLPYATHEGGWTMGDPAGQWPIYDLPHVLASTGTVYVNEGEKCSELAKKLGIVSTTSAHGAGSAKKTDWSPLAGREVVMLPDAGSAGMKYVAEVARILLALTPPARIKLVELPNRGDKGDIEQFMAAGGTKEQIEQLAAAAPEWTPPPEKKKETGDTWAADDWEPDRLSQQVNAQRLVFELRGNARFHVSRGEWMVYSDGRFILDETGEVERAAKRVAQQTWGFVASPPKGFDNKTAFRHALDSEKASGISAMMKLARSEPDISVAARDFDRDGYLLNVLNCTVDLRTGEQRPHRREDLLSKRAPVMFDPDADCPLFGRFLDRITAGDVSIQRYLQRIFGTALAAEQSVQELFIFWGGGANGKNVLLDTIAGLLGDYAGTAPESLLTFRATGQEHPTEIADLCGKRLVYASETEQGAKLRVQLVKRLTGDATIKGRFMRQDFFEFPRTHKLILVTNNKPAINETTHAVWRRVRLVPFTVTIPEQERDVHLTEKLRSEWPGILNWCIVGFLDYQSNGMQRPDAVKVATATYQKEQDALSEFVTDRCEKRPDLFVTRGIIYAGYLDWAKSMGDHNPMDRNSFYECLRRVDGVADDQQRVNGRPERGFSGIHLASLASSFQQAQEKAAATP